MRVQSFPFPRLLTEVFFVGMAINSYHHCLSQWQPNWCFWNSSFVVFLSQNWWWMPYFWCQKLFGAKSSNLASRAPWRLWRELPVVSCWSQIFRSDQDKYHGRKMWQLEIVCDIIIFEMLNNHLTNPILCNLQQSHFKPPHKAHRTLSTLIPVQLATSWHIRVKALTDIKKHKWEYICRTAPPVFSTHTANLVLPHIPTHARTVHNFPELTGSLISIGQLRDVGCVTIDNKDNMHVKDKTGKVIM